MTLRHLLRHQGGIPHNDEAPWLGRMLNVKFRPGSEHRYSTPGYGLLGMVIEAVTGRGYGEAVKTYVGRPLGAPSLTALDSLIAPGAFVTSDIGDLARFAVGMMFRDCLPEALRANKLWKPLARSYGLGWGIKNAGTEGMTVFHSGSNGRPRAQLLLKPRKQLAVVILAQKKDGPAPSLERLAGDLIGLLEDARP